MNPYYELHITMTEKPERIKAAQMSVDLIGWKFSKIDGDIILGAGVKCYATLHLSADKFTQEKVIGVVNLAAARLSELGQEVVRQKVELVVYDQRWT